MKKNIKSRQTFFFHQHRKNALGYMARTKVEPSFLNFSSVCPFVWFQFSICVYLSLFSPLSLTLFILSSFYFSTCTYISLSLFLLVWLGVRFEGRLGISYASGSSLSLFLSLSFSLFHTQTHTQIPTHTQQKYTVSYLNRDFKKHILYC